MKKNILTVIILALCIVNLVLTALLTFAVMPAYKKTDTLITQICTALDLNLKSKTVEKSNGNIALENIESYTLAETQTINLKSDTEEVRYVVAILTLQLDKSAEDYKAVYEKLNSMENIIWDDVRSIISNYTSTEASSSQGQEKIKEEILAKLQERFQSSVIYQVSFGKFIVQ